MARALPLWALLLVSCAATDRPSHPEAGHTHSVPEASVPTEFVGPFGAWGDSFYVWRGDAYERVFLRGVDLGVGMPGTQPGDLAPRYDDYRRWFARMGELGVNVVRIYTLHFPRFYEALADHNLEHPDTPLWVLHGAWLTANRTAPGHDLQDLTEDFDGRIEEVVDACHGQLSVEHRFGQGWGEYTSDVSPWVLGYLIGREIYAEEVVATDDAHGRGLSYEGPRVSIADANAAEIWMAQRIEHTLEYELDQYAESRPVGFSSWMELDPLTHPTEPWYTGQDVASIDLADLRVHGAPTGRFVSYHCYPYFPHFVNDDPDYQAVSDADGPNPYLGVLRDLAAHYEGLPLVISEFGVPSSWGNAKPAGSGMDHGGHTEAAQARFVARMVGNIHSVGAAGAIQFHWMDGWYKQTWINEPRTFPRDRLRLWHDLMNPQESYGLIAFEPAPPTFDAGPRATGDGRVASIATHADTAFFHVRVELDGPVADGERVLVAFDTVGDDVGEAVLPDGTRPGGRYELVLDVRAPGAAELRVMSSYDLYGVEQGGAPDPAEPGVGFSPLSPTGVVPAPPSERFQFHPTVSDRGLWSAMRWNVRPGVDLRLGDLRARRASEPASSQDAVVIDGARLDVRIPWSLLQFSDPSNLEVVWDDPDTPGMDARPTEGIRVAVVAGGDALVSERFGWAAWDRVPETFEREKPALQALAEAFAAIE